MLFKIRVEARMIYRLQVYHTNVKKDRGQSPLSNHLSRRLQHILDKNPIPLRGIVYENMGHSANQFSVLDDRTAAHAVDDSIFKKSP